jgi:hypothetical protein
MAAAIFFGKTTFFFRCDLTRGLLFSRLIAGAAFRFFIIANGLARCSMIDSDWTARGSVFRAFLNYMFFFFCN